MKLFTKTLICVAALLPSLLLAQSSEYTLALDTTAIEVGEAVTVTWTTDGSPINRDWIGLYKVGDSNYQFSKWKYVNDSTGNFEFVIDKVGSYEFRYFLNGGYQLAAVSETIVVTAGDGGGGGGGGDEYTLALDTTAIEVGEAVTVTWTTDGSPINRDWIGLYKVGDSNYQFSKWKYVNDSTGNFEFVIDKVGSYEFRYFLNGGYQLAAVSETIVVTAGDGGGGGGGGDEYTLALDTTAIEVGEAVTVTWTTDGSPINRDWIGLYKVGDSNYQFSKWKYVNDSTGNFEFVIDKVGSYEFRYFLNGGYQLAAVSETIVVTAGDGGGGGGGGDEYTLALDTTAIEVGEAVTVTWTTDGSPINRDWIGLYKVGDSNYQFSKWKYVNDSTGNFEFVIDKVGSYEFRYFLNGGYQLAAVSETIVVTAGDGGGGGGGGDEYTLALDTTAIEVGEAVTVTWTTDGSPINRDWIGLYKVGDSNYQFSKWKYVNDSTGNFEFVIDKVGSYEFRYFLNGGYQLAAVSETIVVTAGDGGGGGGGGDEYTLALDTTAIEVGEAVTVTWTTDGSPINRDWIGLYKVGDSNYQFSKWKYVNDSTGNFEFVIDKVGSYEFRYFLNGGYQLAAVSETIVVTAGDGGGGGGGYSLTPDQTIYSRGDTAYVTWGVPTGEGYLLNWIGLYEPDASDTEYLDYEFVDFLSNVETFPLDNDGVFEFRFFTNNSFNKVATSEQIIVQNDVSTECVLDTTGINNYPPPTGPIIALGDSITFGYGASVGEDYVSELEDRLNVSIINSGVSGDSTRDALARLQTDVLNQNPSTVIVFLGGNDEIRRFYEQLGDTLEDRNLRDELDEIAESIGYDWMSKPLIPRAETYANIQNIIEQVQATGAVTILVGFDATIFDQQIDDDYQMIANNTNSFFVPNIYSGIFGRPRYMSDLVHPNDAGYDIVADRIQPPVACVI